MFLQLWINDIFWTFYCKRSIHTKDDNYKDNNKDIVLNIKQ